MVMQEEPQRRFILTEDDIEMAAQPEEENTQ
jgi:hypothetical protein